MKTTLILLALAAFAGLTTAQADQIEVVMKEAMKGNNSLHSKVATGKGTPDDAKKLLEYFKTLPSETPPEGDAASWKEKTETLIAAAQGVVEGKPGANKTLQEAGNCKACHNVHKGQ
ncbi:hypothetical protein SAMN02745166_02969 [Prosthecobacter debontii]|uniref:Cytochrome C n=1 Tax=Prosthecobacter debontii TaxID=48467 RepID=A0A1T4YCR5_9BACT|nr:hypothetical protein [Prosthecobacter debontii]SKA99554.1 hypothetical protein SAMN02745166_02969 [Prosthecobacter debontii]